MGAWVAPCMRLAVPTCVLRQGRSPVLAIRAPILRRVDSWRGRAAHVSPVRRDTSGRAATFLRWPIRPSPGKREFFNRPPTARSAAVVHGLVASGEAMADRERIRQPCRICQ